MGFSQTKRERIEIWLKEISIFVFERKQTNVAFNFSNFTRSSPQFEMKSVELQQTDCIGLGYTFLLPMFGTSKLENDSLQSLDSNGKRIWSLPCSPTWQNVEGFKKAINSPKFVCSGFQQLKDPPFESSHPSSPIQWKLFIQSHQIKNQKIKYFVFILTGTFLICISILWIELVLVPNDVLLGPHLQSYFYQSLHYWFAAGDFVQ